MEHDEGPAPDVLIIGGGPAGSTLAALLARAGKHVVVVEKAKHPRFHIGESLLPMNMPLFERLGVREQIEAIGVRKNGIDFAGQECPAQHYTATSFGLAAQGIPDYALQVRRDQFDQLLFEHCGASGAQCWQQTQVESVDLEAQPPQVTVKHTDGDISRLRPRFVVDASGRDAFLASKNGWRQANRKHATAAIYAHFSSAVRRPGQLEGNISIVHFEFGWIWLIPLPNGQMSIGATCQPEYLKTRTSDLESFLWYTLRSVPAVADRIKHARIEGQVHVAANYSYQSSKICGDDFAVIGDAAVFIDPVLSSGVYLAMQNAEDMSKIIRQRLDGDLAGYRRACKAYDKKNKRALAIFSWFIYRFNHPALQYLFQNQRDFLGVQSSVVSMLAGDVFGSSKNIRKLWLFKTLYRIVWLCLGPRSWRFNKHRQRSPVSVTADLT